MPAPEPRKKLSQPNDAPSSVTDRALHPQQSNFPPVNATGELVTFQAAPTAPATNAEERAGKKRGRPSKAEYEQRVREAAERGEVYPLPRKRKTPRPSLEGVAGEEMLTPTKPKTGTAGKDSTGKTKARPKAAPRVAPIKPTLALERDLALEATATEVDQMQIDNEKESARSTIPDTQSTDFPARESLLSGMREYATQGGADTAQSSSTLKGDYSASRTERTTPGFVPATPDPAPLPSDAPQTDSATTKPETAPAAVPQTDSAVPE